MVYKFLLLIAIIFCLTLLLGVVQGRKRFWRDNPSKNSRIFTLRAIVILVVIVLFMVFSMVR